MPPRNRTTAVRDVDAALTRITAAQLIHEAQRDPIPDPDGPTLDELRTVVIFNDAVGEPRRVKADRVVDMLRQRGWIGVSRYDLDALCQRALGRCSYASR